MVNSIGAWYRGTIVPVKHLRPNTIIKDDAIPEILRRKRQPTFVTLNASDFWQKVRIDDRFCVVCLDVGDTGVSEIPLLLKLLFRKSQFKSKRLRAGHVFRINLRGEVQFYKYDSQRRETLSL